jgi:hypothetical protein
MGAHTSQPPAPEKKESRTDKLLREVNVGPEFLDAELPAQYFSHSQYFSWKTCGQAYAYRYIDKIRGPGTPATAKGSAVHGGIEYMLLGKKAGKIPPIADGVQLVSDIFDAQAKEIERWDDAVPGQIKDQSIRLLEHFAVHALPKINPVAMEEGFAKKIGSVPMIGWIDLIDQQPAMIVPDMSPELMELAPTKLVTVDFKTGSARWSNNELRLDTQMTLYAMVKGTPHIRVDQLLSKAKGPEYVRGESVRTPQDVAVLTEDLNEVADFIRAGIFPKAHIDSWKCNEKMCSYWSICRGRKR